MNYEDYFLQILLKMALIENKKKKKKKNWPLKLSDKCITQQN